MMPVSELAQQKQEELFESYTQALISQIKESSAALHKPSLQTIYFWWGTPSRLGSQRLIRIIECIQSCFDTEYVAELSIELNPFPTEISLDIVTQLNKHFCRVFPRVRYSFGIQSFDSDILAEASRSSSFPALTNFLRTLRDLKEPNNVYNFDFIAFGKRNTTRKGNKVLRDSVRQEFFQKFVHSQMADSFSLYCLELFAGAPWYDGSDLSLQKHYGDQDDMMDEYDWIRDVIYDGWYRRYELSNYSTPWRNSLHNRAYRQQDNYLWLGTWATSCFFDKNGSDLYRARCDYVGHQYQSQTALRATQHKNIVAYTSQDTSSWDKKELISETEIQEESIMLSLRTDTGIDISTDNPTKDNTQKDKPNSNLDHFVPDRQTHIDQWQQQWLVITHNDRMILTDDGMDRYNTIYNTLLA